MKRTLLPAVLLLSLVSAVAAQEVEQPAPPEKPPLPQEVQVWVDKIGELVGKSVEYDLSISTEIMAQGRPMQMTATGHVVMLDQKHMRASTTMSMEMAGMPAMVTTLLVVLDGEDAWIEADSPMGKQYLRAGVDQMAKLQESGMGGAPGASMNQLDQIRDLFENYYTNFKVEKEAGLVTISGDILPAMMKEMPQMAGVELKKFRMVLQEQTGFPIETSMSDGEKDVMVFKLSNYKELKKEDVSAETFSYTPPPGVKVIDLGALLGAASAGAAKDDDF